MYGYNPMIDIDRKIDELQKMKAGFQTRQPINIYNNANTPESNFFARYLGENEKVDEILVTHKTAFISFKNRQLSIKETNGDITTYEIILPKDEKDLKIEELERRLLEYEQHINANNEITESTSDDNVKYDTRTKSNSKSVSK